MQEEVSRRTFLKHTTGKVAGAVAVLVTSDLMGNAIAAAIKGDEVAIDAPGYDPEAHQYVYLIDIKKCIGCGSCVRACKRENGVPDGYNRTWVERYRVRYSGRVEIDAPEGGVHGFEPKPGDEEAEKEDPIAKGFFVPKICNHCRNTPCTQVCPVGAAFSSPEGVTLVDEKRCIGCGYCVQACPFGTRFMDPVTHTASKCTLCYHRISKGLLPACVQACPTGTRLFGDGKKVGDKVAELAQTSHVMVLKPELLTEPKCYYIGLSKEVV